MSNPKATSHWHFAHGSTSNGVDGGHATFGNVTDVISLAESLADELGNDGDALFESMSLYAEANDAEGLLKEFKRVQEVEAAREYFANVAKQVKLTFWQEKPGLLVQRVTEKVHETFPLVVGHNESLHAWECESPETCEHWEADE